MAAPVIAIEGLAFAYEGQEVLREVSLEVREGDFLAVLGPNGGGKTTLLRLILGLLQPTAGTIRVFGQPPSAAAGRMGYVPQAVAIRPDFPVSLLDVVLMGLVGETGRRGRRLRPQDRDRAVDCLAKVGLAGLEHRRIGQLSGGQKQRACIARALVSGPRLLLLDEPTSSIDPQGKFCFYDFLRELGRDTTIVVVSHDLSILSARVSGCACVNRRLLATREPRLTPEMLELLYGVHSHACAMDQYLANVGLALPRLAQTSPPASVVATSGDGHG